MSQEAKVPDVHQERIVSAEVPAPVVERTRLKVLVRGLGEVVIVTIGILIAFVLDAWWDGRSMARQEQIHLRALASDFQQNVDALSKLVALEKSIASGSRELLLRARGGSESSKSLDTLISEVFSSARYEPTMGAYEALVNSAGLTLIQDAALRASLAQFAAAVNNDYSESWSNQQYFAFAREFGGRIVLGFHEQTVAADRERTLQELLRDSKFQDHLALRYYGERDMAKHYEGLLQQAEAILAQVGAQVRD
jgi:hypothetical protein